MRDCSKNYSSPSLLLMAATLLLLAVGTAAERTFTDAKGDVFTIADDAPPPKIIINAMGVLSLFHLGLQNSQVSGVYDHWVIRGSTLDLEDPTGEFDSEFAIDPNQEEIEFLKSLNDLSAPCSTRSDGCWLDFDVQDLEGLEFDFIVLFRAGVGGMAQKQADLGAKILWVDYKFEHNTGCYGTGDDFDVVTNSENCVSLSLLDSVRKLEELAAFLGIAPTNQVLRAKQAMCESAANFVARSEDLHGKGIIAAPVALRPSNGGLIVWHPTVAFPWLRTLEELGFPLLHPPGNSNEDRLGTQILIKDWFVNCDSYPFCEDTTGRFPIDFWLFDSRSFAEVDAAPEDAALMFPDKAFAARQYSYWQFNDGAISYTNIARYLDDIVAATSQIERIHDTGLDCEEGLDVVSKDYKNRASGGVVGTDGAYACRGNLQTLYLECPVGPLAPESPSTNNNDSSGGSADGSADGSPDGLSDGSSDGALRLVSSKVLLLPIAVATWLYSF